MIKLNKIIGKNIKKFRIKRNLTQEELACKANLHFTFISRIERGERSCSIETLEYIAKILRIPIIELILPQAENEHTRYEDKLLNKIVGLIRDKNDTDKQYIIKMINLIDEKEKKQ